MQELASKKIWFYGWLFEFFQFLWELWLHTKIEHLIFWKLKLWILKTTLTTIRGQHWVKQIM